MTEAQPAQPPPPPPQAKAGGDDGMPMRFGKYTLIRKLAVGGMAKLFLALQRSVAGFEKLIVVKRVLPNLVKDESFIEMLLAEARIAATLNHPNIAHIYDVGAVEGQYYIAMEHVHGEDLRSLVRQMKKKGVTAFPLEHALAIVLGCCAGLAYAHDKRDLDGEPMGIVHRDVSPQNILVTFTGDVKLVDFGIAKAGRGGMEDTGSGQLKGKVPYMSPEQAQGLELDKRSDIFSLGIMLFELTTGRRLFRGKNEMETLRRIVEEEYPRPRDLNPHLSPRLEEIILRALEKDPERRYQSAREMQADLEDYIRSEQLKVSALSLGSWMQDLFGEKLDAQKRMLQEGRQLAEVLAEQAALEEQEGSLPGGTYGSGVRQKPASKAPWILLALVLLAAGGVGAWFLTRPPPEPSTPTGPGVIAIESTPPGAAIWIDGDRRGERTPAELTELPVGAAYSVKLTHEGYAPHTERVALTEEEPRAQVDATLERPTASDFAVLNVRTVPAGARVLLDGRDTGETTPATIPEITPGERHTLALTLDGYVTRNETVSLERGAAQDLSFELERTPLGPGESIIRIVTEPENARVRFDGEWHESGSPYEFRVPTRRYEITVAKTGFRTEEREVALTSGEASELEVELRRRPTRGRGRGRAGPPDPTPSEPTSREPGRLTFNSRPWCNVSVDGRNAGQTPVVNFQLPPGRHTIVCENPQAGSRRVVVNIPPGQTVRRSITLE
ncbi:MAG TPA: serine/threonine-protein kinase [Sandaracinaceae bacterium LLY-WYZ-13_1]|nr:serine/threonine-protein kinase [Sandaracinaceae bacterium LLY-WYZ-13_1]